MKNIKNDYALDMSKLVNQLRVKAAVMEMGERIAWGSDIALMREAADRVEALEEVVNNAIAEAELVELLKDKARLDWLEDAINTIVDRNLPDMRAAIDEAMAVDPTPRPQD
jgi:hypothetical protein